MKVWQSENKRLKYKGEILEKPKINKNFRRQD